MLGPLPFLYRVIVGVVALLAFVGLGAWFAVVALPDYLLAPAGAGIGAACGILVAAILLHGATPTGPERAGLRQREH